MHLDTASRGYWLEQVEWRGGLQYCGVGSGYLVGARGVLVCDTVKVFVFDEKMFLFCFRKDVVLESCPRG